MKFLKNSIFLFSNKMSLLEKLWKYFWSRSHSEMKHLSWFFHPRGRFDETRQNFQCKFTSVSRIHKKMQGWRDLQALQANTNLQVYKRLLDCKQLVAINKLPVNK